jgi:hypothetical protein
MRAAAIFFLARVRRAAMVASATRKARAMSGVAKPQTSRSVRATCASGASAGWQHVKISRSRSSGMASVGPPAGSGMSRSSGSTSNGSFAASVCRRRIRLRALRRATVVSQAPGRSGRPSRSHARSAWT